jgi:hypothetical protein
MQKARKRTSKISYYDGGGFSWTSWMKKAIISRKQNTSKIQLVKIHDEIILYFSILLHCIVQWVLQVMFPSACIFIVFWFSLSFTTYFGLHGHFQMCRIFIFICLKDSALFFFFFHCDHVKKAAKQNPFSIWK